MSKRIMVWTTFLACAIASPAFAKNIGHFFIDAGAGGNATSYQFNPPKVLLIERRSLELVDSGETTKGVSSIEPLLGVGWHYLFAPKWLAGGDFHISKTYFAAKESQITAWDDGNDTTAQPRYDFQIRNIVKLDPQFLIGYNFTQNILGTLGIGVNFAKIKVSGNSNVTTNPVEGSPASANIDYDKRVWLIGPSLSFNMGYYVTSRLMLFARNTMHYMPKKDIGHINFTASGFPVTNKMGNNDVKGFSNTIFAGARFYVN